MDLRYKKLGLTYVPEYRRDPAQPWEKFNEDELGNKSLKSIGDVLVKRITPNCDVYTNGGIDSAGKKYIGFLREVDVNAWLGAARFWYQIETTDFDVSVFKKPVMKVSINMPHLQDDSAKVKS
jgi:hypothetical protein